MTSLAGRGQSHFSTHMSTSNPTHSFPIYHRMWIIIKISQNDNNRIDPRKNIIIFLQIRNKKKKRKMDTCHVRCDHGVIIKKWRGANVRNDSFPWSDLTHHILLLTLSISLTVDKLWKRPAACIFLIKEWKISSSRPTICQSAFLPSFAVFAKLRYCLEGKKILLHNVDIHITMWVIQIILEKWINIFLIFVRLTKNRVTTRCVLKTLRFL